MLDGFRNTQGTITSLSSFHIPCSCLILNICLEIKLFQFAFTEDLLQKHRITPQRKYFNQKSMKNAEYICWEQQMMSMIFLLFADFM